MTGITKSVRMARTKKLGCCLCLQEGFLCSWNTSGSLYFQKDWISNIKILDLETEYGGVKDLLS